MRKGIPVERVASLTPWLTKRAWWLGQCWRRRAWWPGPPGVEPDDRPARPGLGCLGWTVDSTALPHSHPRPVWDASSQVIPVSFISTTSSAGPLTSGAAYCYLGMCERSCLTFKWSLSTKEQIFKKCVKPNISMTSSMLNAWWGRANPWSQKHLSRRKIMHSMLKFQVAAEILGKWLEKGENWNHLARFGWLGIWVIWRILLIGFPCQSSVILLNYT